MKAHFSIGAVLLPIPILLATACGDDDHGLHDSGTPTTDAPTLESFKATVRRTTAGVPHVKADNLGGGTAPFKVAETQD